MSCDVGEVTKSLANEQSSKYGFIHFIFIILYSQTLNMFCVRILFNLVEVGGEIAPVRFVSRD